MRTVRHQRSRRLYRDRISIISGSGKRFRTGDPFPLSCFGGIQRESGCSFECPARCGCPGTDLGNHVDRSVYHLQGTGPGGPDGRRQHGHRRRRLRHADAERMECMDCAALRDHRRNACRTSYRSFPHGDGHPGDPCRDPDPAVPVLPEPGCHGLQGQPGDQCHEVPADREPAECAYAGIRQSDRDRPDRSRSADRGAVLVLRNGDRL